ncbi:MAG: polysaccharide pyruvyl transferase family protein [Anaerolineales bacterium]
MHSEIKPLRILVDHGGYGFANLGDLALLQVAVIRIYQHFPDAKLFIFTDSTQTLKKYFPGAIPVLPQLRKNWNEAKIIPIPERFLPEPWTKKLSHLEVLLKSRIPRIAHFMIRLNDRLLRTRSEAGNDYFSIIQDSDMVVVSGGGFLTDYFKNHADGILDTLQLAQNLGKPTAMFGQGIGPLENKFVRKKAKRVLPRLKVLVLRDSLTSMDYGKVFNVPQDRIIVTGDDAIEVAIKQAQQSEGKRNIGVNIRQAYYAGNFQHLLPAIGGLLEDISRSNGIPITPIPVQIGKSNSDLSSIAQMCDLDAAEYEFAQKILSPEDLVRQINRCRVVVTGSYHAGVFALACGIPVVALVGSDYYERKFNGLAFQFGLGCKIVQLNSETILADLRKAIENGLHSQNEIESKLIEKAKQQVEISRNAWSRFFALERN